MSKCKSKAHFSVANDERKREKERERERERERKKERKREKERESDGEKFNERHLCCYNRGKISNTYTHNTKRKDTKKYARKQSER